MKNYQCKILERKVSVTNGRAKLLLSPNLSGRQPVIFNFTLLI